MILKTCVIGGLEKGCGGIGGGGTGEGGVIEIHGLGKRKVWEHHHWKK